MSWLTIPPGVVFPAKYEVRPDDCQRAFARIGLNKDLRCTPTVEGYLAGGLWGVLWVSLLWGPAIRLAGWLATRRQTLPRILGYIMIVRWSDVEAGSLPHFGSLRAIIICGVPIALMAWAVKRVLAQKTSSQPAARRPLAPRDKLR